MKKFMIIWLGELVSSIGSGMTSFSLAIYMYQLTGSATWVSLIALLAFMPTILLNPVGGILADRYDRRLMMILGDSLSAIGLFVILISIQTGHAGVVPIGIGVTISAVFIALLEPAYKATVTDLLTEEEYAKASGLIQIAANSKYLISPFLAGLLLSVTDIRVILIIDIATFFVTVFTITTVKKSIHTGKAGNDNFHFWRELREGRKSITDDRGVSRLVLLMTFVCFFIAFLQTLMAPMVLNFADARTLGGMESISAVGMVLGSVIIGIINIKRNYSKFLIAALVAAGVFMALSGTTTRTWLVIFFCFLFFTALPFVNTSADVLVRMRIPNHVQGRAWGMISVMTQMGFVAAYAVCGPLADYVFGPMLMDNGRLAGSVGRLIGTGGGRGIGFMFMIAGGVMVAIAILFASKKSIRDIETRTKDQAASLISSR